MDEKTLEAPARAPQAAAETWPKWGMNCACRCYEGLDWTKAKLSSGQEAERYPNSDWANWYFFCKRTGKGDLSTRRTNSPHHYAAVGRPESLVSAGRVDNFQRFSPAGQRGVGARCLGRYHSG